MNPDEIATQILNEGHATFATTHVSGNVDSANAKDNMLQTMNGEAAKRSSYENAPGGTVHLNRSMVLGMRDLGAVYGFSFFVTEIAGGSHSTNSRHYLGVAFDIGVINGQRVDANHPDLVAIKQKLQDLGGTEILGPGDAGHDTHVHAAWPAP